MTPDVPPISSDLSEHLDLFMALKTNTAFWAAVEDAVSVCTTALADGHKILLCGNGGSAADCQHIATELTIRYVTDRTALPAIALTTDSSALTAAANDMGFDHVFSRQIEALGQPGDVLIAISTSGRSPNVIRAAQAARQKNMPVIFLGGGNGGEMPALSDVSVIVPSLTTARIQEVHILIGHTLCGQIEHRLGLVGT